jgi:hypothetical protein
MVRSARVAEERNRFERINANFISLTGSTALHAKPLNEQSIKVEISRRKEADDRRPGRTRPWRATCNAGEKGMSMVIGGLERPEASGHESTEILFRRREKSQVAIRMLINKEWMCRRTGILPVFARGCVGQDARRPSQAGSLTSIPVGPSEREHSGGRSLKNLLDAIRPRNRMV